MSETFRVVVLICKLALPHADCQEHTADQVIKAPQTARSSQMCGLGGQMFLGSLAESFAPGPDEYLKIQCRHLNSQPAG